MISVILLLVISTLVYKYFTRHHDYWLKKGVIHETPVPLFGNNLDKFLGKKNMIEISVDVYKKFSNEKVVGFYRQNTPELFVRDPDLIKNILSADFDFFHNRGMIPVFFNYEPLTVNTFTAEGNIWHILRKTNAPAYSQSKVRYFMSLLKENIMSLEDKLLSKTKSGQAEIPARDITDPFILSFIHSIAFGVENDDDENFATLKEITTLNFDRTFSQILGVKLRDLFPDLLKSIKVLAKSEERIKKVVNNKMTERNYEPSPRNDFIDYLMHFKKRERIIAESIEETENDGSSKKIAIEIDEKLIAAQAFTFLAAGFETSSGSTAHTLHQLAWNPEILKKTQEEIDQMLAKHDNDIWEAMKDMRYLDWVVKESLRMFPSLGFVYRECVKPYTIKDLNLTIDPGVRIFIPLQALHNDPKYFDNPDEFRPERFDPSVFDENAYRYIYMPFGQGPRMCIGYRLGSFQSKLTLISILSRFDVKPGKGSRRRLKTKPFFDLAQKFYTELPLIISPRKKELNE